MENLLIGIMFLSPIPVHAETIEVVPVVEQMTIPELIEHFSKKYNVESKTLLKVAECESSLNKDAINYNDGGVGKHSVGVFQYQEATFNAFEDLFGRDLDYYNYIDQIELTAFAFSKGLAYHWSCYKIHFS